MGKVMLSVFNGRCKRCDKRVTRGETIEWLGKGQGIVCSNCSSDAANGLPPPAPAPAAPVTGRVQAPRATGAAMRRKAPRKAPPRDPRASDPPASWYAPGGPAAGCYCTTLKLTSACPVCGKLPGGAKVAPPANVPASAPPPAPEPAEVMRKRAIGALRDVVPGKAAGAYTFADKCAAVRRLQADGQINAAIAFSVGLADLPDKQALLARLGAIDAACARRGYVLREEVREREDADRRAAERLGFNPRFEAPDEPPVGHPVVEEAPAAPPPAPPPVVPPPPALGDGRWTLQGGDWRGLWEAVNRGILTPEQAVEYGRQWKEAGL